ncbi:hypothetical protein ACFSR2_14395 [Emticicia soli]|uniref:Secreted protein n=1 Tax=Emticicia soli TaxID=2027878 RepID=A0ABW5J7N3_9BACT
MRNTFPLIRSYASVASVFYLLFQSFSKIEALLVLSDVRVFAAKVSSQSNNCTLSNICNTAMVIQHGRMH